MYYSDCAWDPGSRVLWKSAYILPPPPWVNPTSFFSEKKSFRTQTSTKRRIQDPGSQAQSLKYMVCQAHLAGNHASEYYQTLYQLDLTESIGLNNPLCIHNYKTNSLYSLNL